MTSTELSTAFGEIIKNGHFTSAPYDAMDAWTRRLVIGFLDVSGLRWELARETVGPARVVKVHDNFLKYLLTMPVGSYEGQPRDQFYWLIGNDPDNDDHGVHPDVATNYLLTLPSRQTHFA